MRRSLPSDLPTPPDFIGGFSIAERKRINIEIWPDGTYFIPDTVAASEPWIHKTLLRNGDFWTHTIGDVRGWFGKCAMNAPAGK